MEDRRAFLKSLAGLTAGIMLPYGSCTSPQNNSDKLGALLPKRLLGSTGESVTMLGLGGAHIARMGEKEAQKTIEVAMEGGVRFFDTAESYGSGESERRYGKFLVPKYRDDVFIMTKSTGKDAETARKHLEGSLKRMNVDYIDLWQVHSISSPQDVDSRIENGVLEMALKAQEEGKIRHLGFTGHRDYEAHAHMLERSDIFQTAQMPINCADPSYRSFIKNVVPKMVERNMGVIAMKTLANGGFFGGTSHFQHGENPKLIPDRVSIKEALYFSWSLPVSVLITGPNDVEQMQEKIDLAREFTEMSEADRQKLIDKVADMAGTTVEFYKA